MIILITVHSPGKATKERKMGGTYSNPVPQHLDTGGFVCMVLRSYDKFRVLHGPPEVVAAVRRVVR